MSTHDAITFLTAERYTLSLFAGKIFDVFKTENIRGQTVKCRQCTPMKPNLYETFFLSETY